MKYCVTNSKNIIENIFISNDADFAELIGALPYYEGASIGKLYAPPIPISKEDRLEAQVTYTAMMTDTLIGG